MHDETVLRADVYRPSGDGPYPVLLMRTPYGKEQAQQNVYAHPSAYVRAGFIVVIQDVRGRYSSEGVFVPFRAEADDGAVTVEWCRTLAASSGHVFMYGYSYAGAAALLGAVRRPRGLAGIMPAMTSADVREGWLYRNGVLRLAFARAWALQLAEQSALRAGENDLARQIAQRAQARLGLDDAPARECIRADLARLAPYFHDWLDRRDDESYWQDLASWPGLGEVEIPSLLIGGWYDDFLTGTLNAYRRLRSGCNPGMHSLIIGPWCHSPWTRYTGAIDFGPRGVPRIDEQMVNWARSVIAGRAEGQTRYFMMGSNSWHESEAWPPAPSQRLIFSLRSDGGANSRDGDGRLELATADGDPPDHLLTDPRNAVPSLRGTDDASARTYWGPVDQEKIEIRNDVLCYTSDAFHTSIAICGTMTLSLWVRPMAPSFDVHATVCDVYPDGRSYPVSRGVARARKARAVEDASTPVRVDIPLDDTCVELASQHRLRLNLAGTSYPDFVRNSNATARDIDASLLDFRAVAHTILHDDQHPSCLAFDTPPMTSLEGI